ncbi:type I-E CRISPR-associated protein Cas5/CasD [Streptomyces naganishii]|uniref:Type I-E CRISPR-associated protein Cas5/CasD n=1 Tax=Streptomyces naganishii JCM 4654 TaxID=1306179 RepID=A0A918YAJ0_9ACTN|nr:type I-E CRISPR-associated protein Cas5/CasD [Streptomyces naganishii]GHD95942.1 type I-E CRISPR-associated protein Cas5/CasD [Streptomyces naganishii JCM 4654]
MSVLTLRLAGPLQSWGASARFARRTTESAPTKSGVIGLLAAAAGIERGDDNKLRPLAALRFGVRIDQPGTRVRDFQTAHHGVTGKSMPLSNRFYLADAVFLAALEGDHRLLAELHAALLAPVYAPFLGRRSCPPSLPVELHLHDHAGLQDALREEPWQASPWYRRQYRGQNDVELTVLREADAHEQNTADTLRDQPLSFAAEHRRHALRTQVSYSVRIPNPSARQLPRHDPFDALDEESA